MDGISEIPVTANMIQFGGKTHSHWFKITKETMPEYGFIVQGLRAHYLIQMDTVNV